MMHPFFRKLEDFGGKTALSHGDEAVSYSGLLELARARKNELQAGGAKPGEPAVLDFKGNSIPTIVDLFALALNKSIIILYEPEAGLPLLTDPAVFEESGLLGDAGLVLQTSGTTGKAAAVLYDLDKFLDKFLPVKSPKRALLVFSIEHIAGLEVLFSVLSGGGTLIIPTTNNAAEYAGQLRAAEVDFLSASPSLLNLMLLDPDFNGKEIPSLRRINYGSERISATTFAKLKERFPETVLKDIFGTTESGSYRELREGKDYIIEDGELLLKKQPWFLGRIPPEGFVPAEDFIRTGDRARMGESGLPEILGRKDRQINVGGEKVFPERVEELLLQWPEVTDVLVYGKPNPLLGEMVCTDLVLTEQTDPEVFKKEFRRRCRSCMAEAEVPVKLSIVEKLEITFRGKRNMQGR